MNQLKRRRRKADNARRWLKECRMVIAKIIFSRLKKSRSVNGL
jgi:hypothetical protein